MLQYFQQRYPRLDGSKAVCADRDFNVRGCLGQRTNRGVLRVEVKEDDGPPYACLWLFRSSRETVGAAALAFPPQQDEQWKFADRVVRHTGDELHHQVCMRPTATAVRR